MYLFMFSVEHGEQRDDYGAPTWDDGSGFDDQFDDGSDFNNMEESNTLVSQPRQVGDFSF